MSDLKKNDKVASEVESKSENLTPAEYFDIVKGRKQQINDETLDKIYNNCLELLNKYNITGQVSAMKKLMFHLDNIERERQLITLGIDTFVYKSDIEDFVKNVEGRVVKICELKDYEREIPDDIVKVIDKTKNIFTCMYVLFTDYTGTMERQTAIEHRAKDPILFGSFFDRSKAVIVERFYFLGDWEDDYCDLTLDKMVAEVRDRTGVDIEKKIKTPEDIEELRAQLENLKPNGEDAFLQVKKEATKPNLFRRIKMAIKG